MYALGHGCWVAWIGPCLEALLEDSVRAAVQARLAQLASESGDVLDARELSVFDDPDDRLDQGRALARGEREANPRTLDQILEGHANLTLTDTPNVHCFRIASFTA